MPRIEKNSKAWFRQQYNISDSTLRRWINYLITNANTLAVENKNTAYLIFHHYNRFQRNLTPNQAEIFIKHYGQP